MVAHINEHAQLPDDLDPDYIEGFRAWLTSRPGFCGGYQLLESETGHAISVTLWESHDALAEVGRAMRRGEAPVDGRISRQSPPQMRVVDVAFVF